MNRQLAFAIVCEFVKDSGLRRHMLAVEAAMRFYAARLGEDPEIWGLAGLLHDFDWEIHPTLEDHPAKGAPILRQRGVDEQVVTAILSHNPVSTGIAPATPMLFALSACDEITGLITAVALVRPTKDIRDVEVKSEKEVEGEVFRGRGASRGNRIRHRRLRRGLLRRQPGTVGARGQCAGRDARGGWRVGPRWAAGAGGVSAAKSCSIGVAWASA